MDAPDIRVRGTPEAGEDDAGPTSSATPPRAEPGAPPQRSILRVASSPDNERPAQPRARVSAPEEHRETAPTVTPVAATPAARRPSRLKHAAGVAFRTVMTLLILALALLGAVLIWDYYITAPWTRDGRVRVQVASVTPQISGQITEIRVLDNQFVHKGDVLYVIDPFDFQTALDSDRAQLRMKAADLQVKKVQAQRRQSLTDLATTAEEQQQYVGSAVQADAAFQAAQTQVNQAEINLKRTQVTSPVNGFVHQPADAGGRLCQGRHEQHLDHRFRQLLDRRLLRRDEDGACLRRRPGRGAVDGLPRPHRRPMCRRFTRGISVSDAAPSTQGLPQRRSRLYLGAPRPTRPRSGSPSPGVPAGVPLVSGMTATRDHPGRRGARPGRLVAAALRRPAHADRRHAVPIHARRRPASRPWVTPTARRSPSRRPEPSRDLTPEQINPGLTPGMSSSAQGTVATPFPRRFFESRVGRWGRVRPEGRLSRRDAHNGASRPGHADADRPPLSLRPPRKEDRSIAVGEYGLTACPCRVEERLRRHPRSDPWRRCLRPRTEPAPVPA